MKGRETFFSQLLIVHQFSVSQVVEDGAEVGGVSVNHVGTCLVLLDEMTDRLITAPSHHQLHALSLFSSATTD